MKHYLPQLLWVCCIVVFTTSCNSNDSIAQKDEEKKEEELPEITHVTKAEIVAYFSQWLDSRTCAFEKNDSLSLDSVDKAQTRVWQAWVAANEAKKESKLIAWSPLSEGKSGEWVLPEELEAHATMPYYLGTKGTAPQAGYPFYIYLHGSGPKDSEWKTGLQLGNMFEDSPSVYFIPQIPNTGDYYRWWQKAKQYAWEKALRLAFVSGAINPNRVYIFGISEGGYGSQRLASFYADYWAGAGPMAGGEPLINAPVENCSNMAFSLLTGALDDGFHRNRLTQLTLDRFTELENEHPGQFVHRINLIPNMGHSIDYTLTTVWLKNYSRNPYPKYVNWENFPMDGCYRDAFYNLVVTERSNKDDATRTNYEMTINGNTIDISVSLVSYSGVEYSEYWGFALKYDKSYTPATSGKFKVYLNNQLVDLSKEVVVNVNGKRMYSGKVKTDLKNLVESCATFYDPERLYPAMVEIDLSKGNGKE